MNDFGAGAANILGEVLWHTATKDDSIALVSHYHAYEILRHAGRFLPARGASPVRFLEVAAYAHITGYLLAQRHGWKATLSDISVETLALGASHARENGLDAGRVRRVAVDFHDLPFPGGAFDVVYISSALHHTLRWQVVLNELLRVTAPGGILVLQNEPCRRDFCFYKFATNRPGNFRPVETELDRLGVLRTVAEPFVGSRPETLFGMVENQRMPLPEVLQLLRSQGAVEELTLNSQANMSSWDCALLATPAGAQATAQLAARVEAELSSRVDEARRKLTATDIALGIALPSRAEMTEMAASLARSIEALPPPAASAVGGARPDFPRSLTAFAAMALRSAANFAYGIAPVRTLAMHLLTAAARQAHRAPALDALLAAVLRRLWAGPAKIAGDREIAIANIFGGAFAAVVRKTGQGPATAPSDELRYLNGSRKDVLIGYPPALATALESAYDLIPDLQAAARDEITRHFPETEWRIGGDATVRDLALLAPRASIRLRATGTAGRFVVLLRLSGEPLNGAYRVQLLADGTEIAGVDVHQPDSFLLRGELPAHATVPELSVAVCGLDRQPLAVVPPVRVAALRIACLAGA